METVREEIAETRAGTDQSLIAERATTDTSLEQSSTAQRILDDLIERDRISADERLWRFRRSEDTAVTSGRTSSSPAAASVVSERQAADRHTDAERQDTDAVLQRERARADAAIDSERQEHEADHAELEARRQDTNAQLIAERQRTDVAVAALGTSKQSLTQARSEHGHDLDILAMVTHDLRSPLSIISANAQHIAESSREETMRDAANDVSRAAARMERLLMDLLDVARIDAGKLRIVKRPHDVGVLVAHIMSSYEPLFAARGVAFTTEHPPGPLMASFDHDRIVQVISNLLGNAMKFTGRLGAVSLSAAAREDGVELVVRDTGAGIRPAELSHVFEKFWQIDSQTRRGLGLGLHISKSIIEGHGGRIWAESEFGRGAAFFFTLPFA